MKTHYDSFDDKAFASIKAAILLNQEWAISVQRILENGAIYLGISEHGTAIVVMPSKEEMQFIKDGIKKKKEYYKKLSSKSNKEKD